MAWPDENATDNVGNVIGIYNNQKVVSINPYLRVFLPLNQKGNISNLPVDMSGKNEVCDIAPANTLPWANTGYFTSYVGTASYLSIPNSAIKTNLYTDSFILAFTLKKQTEAGSGGTTLMGCTNGSSEVGFYVLAAQTSHASARKIGVRFYVNNSLQLSGTFGSIVAIEAAGEADHRVVVVYDAITKILRHYVDGALSYTSPALTVLPTDIITTNFRVGQTTTGLSVDSKFANLSYSKFPSSGLPIDLDTLISNDNTNRTTGMIAVQNISLPLLNEYKTITYNPVTVPAKFLGQHYVAYAAGAPSTAVTYSPKIWRTSGGSVFWREIETSDNNFVWTTLDAEYAYFDGQGQDIIYNIYAPPTTALQGGQSWANIGDDSGRAGAGCVPDLTKLTRFVTNLLTRYANITHISFGNEPKFDSPVVRFTGTTSHTLTAGQTVTGLTSGATGTVVSTINSGATTLTVRLSGLANVATPFANSETIQVDASHQFAATQQNSLYYWFGTAAQLAACQQTVYAAAKAVRAGIKVLTPEFTDGTASGESREWLSEFLDAGGTGYFDALAYHIYNFDIIPVNSSGNANSIQNLNSIIQNVLSTRGISVDKYATECGYTSGWTFYGQTADQPSQAQTLKRVGAFLACAGWKSNIWFTHTQAYDGNPSANATISTALGWIGTTFQGKSITNAYISNSNTLHFTIDGVNLIV